MSRVIEFTEFIYWPVARPRAPCCWDSPHTPVEGGVLSLTLSLPGSCQTHGIRGPDFCTHCQIPKTKGHGGVALTLTPAQELWELKRSGALHGLWECGGCSLRCSRGPSPGTACCVGGRPGRCRTRWAGPGQLWRGSWLAGGPCAHPRGAQGCSVTPCTREKSGGLLRCT